MKNEWTQAIEKLEKENAILKKNIAMHWEVHKRGAVKNLTLMFENAELKADLARMKLKLDRMVQAVAEQCGL